MCKLREFITNNVTPDIEIILKYIQHTVRVKTHRCMLECYFEYFRKMFHFNHIIDKSVEIEIRNAQIASDVILSYDEIKIKEKEKEKGKGSKYLLELFKCMNFFCLKNDPSLLYDIVIEPEFFDLFLEVVEEFDMNDGKLRRAIKNNMPMNYDLNNLSFEFVNELVDAQLIASRDNNAINICNTHGALIKTFSGKKIVCMDISPDPLMAIGNRSCSSE